VERNLPIKIKYREDDEKEPEKPLTYIVGDSKLKQKWKSSWLALKGAHTTVAMDLPHDSRNAKTTKDIKNERMLPLHQIST
jgi:hypothetical protein